MLLKLWPTPRSRSVGFFTDLSLFSEALEIAYLDGFITKDYLIEDLSQRFKGLLFIKNQSPRGIIDLIREMRSFNWLSPCDKRPTHDSIEYCLNDDGKKAFELFKKSKKDFLRLLTIKMDKEYTIPGWFVNRLFTINPKGQGEVVIPAPPRDWSPHSRKWEDNLWNDDLEYQTIKSLEIIDKFCYGAFPITRISWVKKVKEKWERLSNLTRRKVAKPDRDSKGQEKGRMETYKPRLRLAMAMREAAVKHLFSNTPPNASDPDFQGSEDILTPRTYGAWCPRLEALELIFYTDVHPLVSGRLLFPTSVFKDEIIRNSRYEIINTIKDPEGKLLYLHQPKWKSIRELFYITLIQEHQRSYSRVGSIYVSLLDVRDEVCRQLRISATCFDTFIEIALRESIRSETSISISVETDIREDQMSAHRLIRRPVWIEGVPHSLIAIAVVEDKKGVM